jgi:nucleotide-binding universal stress UspA family protein
VNVLIATDLSDASLAGLEGVCSCESGVFSRATVLHVVDLDLYTAGGSIPQIMEYANRVLPEWADRLKACGLETQVRVEQGAAVETIEAVAEEIGADLIVMTSLGHGAATGRIFGSTVEKVASRGRVPVLVERVAEHDGAWCRHGQGSPFARVLLAADLDETLLPLLSYVARLPGESALRVVHVAATPDEAAAAEKDLADAVSAAGLSGTDTGLLVGDPVRVIVEDAAAWNATTITVASCRHSALHRALWGSVARGIAIHAPCSVLLVPPVATIPV